MAYEGGRDEEEMERDLSDDELLHPPLVLNGQALQDDRDELDRLLEDVLDMEEEEEEFVDYHPIQLMCFENVFVECFPCHCHNYQIINPGMNVACNFISEFAPIPLAALGDNPVVAGVYFVASWACSMFYNFNPVYIDLYDDEREYVVRGVTINVRPELRRHFLLAVSKMCEAGAIPCEYLRRIDYSHQQNTVFLYPDTWYRELVEMLVEWQKSETIRAFENHR